MRKLYRSRTNRKLAGVIGGISQYIGIDASLLRVLFIISLFFTVGTRHFIYDFCVFSSK
ncbi:PspC domain-containing protein [Priestia sp. OVL9]|nr:PspC domain-containing protein [Priestia sp. OVL9]